MSPVALVGFLVLFDAAALFALYPRIDFFSGGYLLLTAALAILQATFNRRISDSDEIRQVFYARRLDTLWDKLVPVLGLSELVVFVEYSHKPGSPHSMQIAGLILLALAVTWLLWVDRYLVQHFAASFRSGTLLTGGPYRYVRHPRYMGLLATRFAMPLLFGSIVACLLAGAWLFLVHRRIRLEEAHLCAKFGDIYRHYAAETPGLLTRIDPR